MMRCPECVVAEIPPGARRCSACGYVLAPDDAPADAPLVLFDADEGPRGPRPRGATRLAGVGTGLALGAVAMWLAVALGMVHVEAERDFVLAEPVPVPVTAALAPREAPGPSPVVSAPDPQPVRRDASHAPRSARGARGAAPARQRSALAPATTVHPRTRAAAPPPERVSNDASPSGAAPQVEPGRLSINATPWGNVSLDGTPVGNTPVLDLPIAAGEHVVRVERAGYAFVQRVIAIAPGQRLRITDIYLRPAGR